MLWLLVPVFAAGWEWPWTTANAVLIESAKEGEIERLADLLAVSVGLDLDQPHHGGITALMAAAFKEKSEMVKFLIDAGADPNRAASNGWTPLMAGAASGHAASIAILLASKAEVNECSDELRLCPLHVAASRGHLGAVKLLISNGADMAARTREGDTALTEAKKNNHTECATFIFESSRSAGEKQVSQREAKSRSKSEL
jgi:ankyrin repeat protein